jgi:acid phosphatase class B
VVFAIDDTTLLTLRSFEEPARGRYRGDNDRRDTRFSRPKPIAWQLVTFHRDRSDTIVFL